MIHDAIDVREKRFIVKYQVTQETRFLKKSEKAYRVFEIQKDLHDMHMLCI